MSDLSLDPRVLNDPAGHAVLDPAHIGDIEGALGTLYQGDIRGRATWKARFATLMAIVGPGLIVMVGDNDAGAFSTYGQAGQNYGTALAVDAVAAGPGALRQPGDGAAPRRGDGRRPCAPDPGAVRQVLGRLQRHRPVHPERGDHRHRVHRHQFRPWLSWRAARMGHRGRRRNRHCGRQHRQLPPFRAVLAGAVLLQPAAGADLSDGASAPRADRA